MTDRSNKTAAHRREIIKSESRYAATELIQRERFIGEIYDASHSDDGIAEAFMKNGNPIFITSLNFLTYDKGCTNVVTEPFPNLGADYVRKGLELCTGKVGLLLPVSWMTTPAAKTLFDQTPIARIYILTKRLRFRTDGRRLVPMAWFIFERGHFERPVIVLI